MKRGNFALYNGKEYSADYIKGKGIILRSQDEEDLKKGFDTYEGYNKNIMYVKYVQKEEIDGIYKIRNKAVYQGCEFEVMDERDGMISIIGIVGDYSEFIKRGMKCIDKGVYQKWIHKDEADIRIIKEDL